MRTIFQVPGTDVPLEFERDAAGRLISITAGGRCYLHAPSPEECSYGDGFVRTRTLAMPGALLRSVTANGERWTETYRWNDARLMSDADGVAFEYDAEHRLLSCRGADGSWFYGYSGSQLTVIDAPHGLRQIVRDATGRPSRVRESNPQTGSREYAIDYDSDGHRLPRLPRPASWHCDEAGRVWTIRGSNGAVTQTFLWNDFHCVARIDGPPGAPLAAVFSLDLTGTPVRVIERGGMRRLPRDGFGEVLLRERGVPGLYSGIVDGSLVRLPFRRLDPGTGSFDAPDPFTGMADDPRRATGFDGPLLAEFAKAGPYGVARNNPVTLADPTGAISDLWWLIPSALTWSYQNTVASIFGFWLTLDFTPAMILWFLPNLFTFFQNDNLRDHNIFGGFFDVEFLAAKNYDAFALRSSGMLDAMKENTWTYQFLVNDSGDNFTQLEFARLFQPSQAFTPGLYGTVLRCVPTSGDPFLLQGQRTPPNGAVLTTWSRSGGTAVPALPGSLEPVFPEGALHFNTVMTGRRCPQAAKLQELTPQSPLIGTVTNLAQGTWAGDARGVATGQTVALIGKGVDIVTIATVAAAGSDTVAAFQSSAPAVLAQTVRLRGVGAALGPENLKAQDTRALSLVASALNYVAGDVLRATTAGQPVVSATVAAIQSRLKIDEPLPSTLANIHVFLASAGGSEFDAVVLAANQLRIDSGAVPGKKDGLVAGGIPAIVQDVNGNILTLDRDISALGPATTAVKWRPLTRGVELGLHKDSAESVAEITYEPAALRTAPTTGFVWCEAGIETAARVVVSLEFDGLLVDADLPDAAATYAVELFKPQPPDVTDVRISSNLSLDLGPTVSGTVRAFQLLEFDAAGIAPLAAPLIAGATLSGTDVTAALPAGALPSIAPADVVILGTGGTTFEAAVVSDVRVTVQFSRALPGRDTNLTAAKLSAGPSYAADRIDGLIVRVRPLLNGDRVDLPRFRKDELVLVSWGAGSSPAQERLFRIDGADGSMFVLVGDDPIDPAITTAGALRVQRLTIADPGTGTSLLGRAGARAGTPPAPDQIEFSTWNANSFRDRDLIAIIGDTVVAGRVRFAAPAMRAVRLTLAAVPKLTSPVDVSAPKLAGAPPSQFSTAFSITPANAVVITDAAVTGTQFVAVPYVASGPEIDGTLKAGSVRVPDDHENASIENTRREALVDHELTHTLQSARLGPWLFTWWPNWVTEMVGETTSLEIDGPEYSRTVDAQYREAEAEIEVPSRAEVGLDADTVVQVSQDGRTATIKLHSRTDNVFALNRDDLNTLSSNGIRPGAVGVRKELSAFWSDFYETTQKVLDFATIGGLMNLFSTASYGGLIWLFMRLVQAIRGLKETTYRGAITNATTITLAEGVSAGGLTPGTSIAIQQGSQTTLRTITAQQAQVVTVDRDIPLTGSVELTIYRPSAPLFGDYNDYFPATAADRNKPAVIKVQGLALEVNDRVLVRSANNHTKNTKITVKNADGTVELEDPILVGDTSAELLVARIGKDDPLGWVDQFVLDKMHLGFLQYLHDPYGQIHYRAEPQSTAGKVLTRSARYLLGTKSWGIPILTGYFWWDNAFRRDEAELSAMEQEASFRSGDTYCPVGSLHGNLDVVGDVGRYWLTGTGGLRDAAADMIDTSRQDGPGVHWQQYHALTISAPANPGYSVPDVIATKDATARNWQSVASRGWIPTDGALERSSGTYVAFTRPPVAGAQHTIDARSIVSLAEARNAQTKGPSGTIASFVVPVPPTTRLVKVSFPRTVNDVAVTVAGIPAAEFDPATAASVKLIPFQTATVSVTPNGARTYRTTVSQPGLLATVGADGATLHAGNVPVGTKEFVEVSRFYEVDGDIVTGIGPVHLPADIHIGVRRFDAEISDQLILRADLDPASPAVADAHAGDVLFLLVPAPPVVTPPPTISPAPVVPLSPTVAPEVLDPNVPAQASAIAHLNGGVAYRVTFVADQPPEVEESVAFEWKVGLSVADSATVKAAVALKPHFDLHQTGAAGFDVAANATFTVESSDGRAIQLERADAGITAGTPPAGALPSQVTLQADGTTGGRTVVVRDTSTTPLFAARRFTVS